MKLLKFLSVSVLLAGTLVLASCGGNDPSAGKSYVLEYENAKSEYETEVKITTKNIKESDAECFTKEEGKITFKAVTATDSEKKIEVTLEGYFKGQIVNEVKDLVINLNGVYLENENDSVFSCSEKTEFSAKKDTTNYIVTTGNLSKKNGAVKSSKKLEFGGAGACYIIDNICHGIKGDKVQFKGSGKYYIQGTKDGSAINCNEFIIGADDPEKMVSIYLYNAKNGIKADNSIDIQNGKLFFYGNETALKTDKATEGAATSTTIKLANCTITLEDVSTLQETDDFDKDDSVTINK